MGTRARLVAGLAIGAGLGLVIACGSDAGESDFGGSSGGSSGASTSSSGGFGTSGGDANGASSGASGNDGNCAAPVDMFIMFDRSNSMGNDCDVGQTVNSKWCKSINALSGYFKSAGAKDHAAALQFFPLPNHQTAECTSGDRYANAAFPAMGYQTLPSNAFDMLLSSTTQEYGTPTEAGIRGLARFTAANRRGGHVTIGILITDGDPVKCNQNLGDLSKLLDDHYQATKVRTYVIGMEGASFGNLEKLAQGGNAPSHPDMVGTITDACGNGAGPCKHWNVGDGDPAVFTAALAAIQESADGCKDGGGYINPVN